jgi:hypothetical protein
MLCKSRSSGLKITAMVMLKLMLISELKAELAELLEEEAKADALRRLPLYSCRITGFKFVCSRCYDKVYTFAIVKKPKVQKSL